jgi:hypothetical protein
MLFFWAIVPWIVDSWSSSEPAMAPPPSRAAPHPRSVIDFLSRIDVFALSFAFDWCRLWVVWWLKSGKPELSGELWAPAMAAAGRSGRGWPRFSFSFIGINTSRLSLDQGLRLEDTLLAVSFVKEPLRFCELKPAVLSVIHEIRLLVLKTYFFPVNQKYVFWYLQFCHSNCFGRKIFVLTPIWPVQDALGSYLRALHVSIVVQ